MITAPIHFRTVPVSGSWRPCQRRSSNAWITITTANSPKPTAASQSPSATLTTQTAPISTASSAATRPFTQENGVGVSSSATVTPQEGRDLQGQRLRGVEDVGVPPETVDLAEVAGADHPHALL